MNLRLRKGYVLAAGGAVLVSLIGFGIYTFFFKNDFSSIQETTNPSETIEGQQVFYSDDPPLEPFLDARIISVPGPDAQESAKKEYVNLIDRESVQQNTTTLTDCKPDPIAIKVKKGSEITITNNDEIQHIISVNAENEVVVPASGSATLVADFGKGTGIYNYRCDLDEVSDGVFYVRSEL